MLTVLMILQVSIGEHFQRTRNSFDSAGRRAGPQVYAAGAVLHTGLCLAVVSFPDTQAIILSPEPEVT